MEFIDEAKKEYDLLIFDTPPILSATDAVIIGAKVDGVLLVYRIGAVSRLLLRRSANQLEQVKGHVLGVILNGMRPDVSPDFEDYKHYKYYYSYGEEEKSKRHRKKKMLLPWADRRRESLDGTEDSPKQEIRESGSAGKGRWSKILRIGLLVSAAGLLTGAILYQNGVVDPPAPGFLEGKDLANKAEKSTLSLEKGPIIEASLSGNAEPKSSASSQHQYGPEKESRSDHREARHKVHEKQRPLASEADPSATPIAVQASPPAAVTKPDAKNKVSLADSSTRPYSLYLGSVPNPDLAKRGVSRYVKKGISPYAVKLELSNGVWYRIYAGTYSDRQAGERLIREKKLRSARVVKTPWANLIGVYSSSGALESTAKDLRDLDYFPYVVKCRDGTARLYVGAFSGRDRAEGQHEELEARGIEARTVMR
jgi:cell division septation protein DedD